MLKDWILGITAASIVVSAAVALVPEGKLKKSVRFVGGFVILVALIRPFQTFDPEVLKFYDQSYQSDFEAYGQRMEENSKETLKLVIENKTGTYILQKAELFGIACTVTVETALSEEGYPVPVAVAIEAAHPPSAEAVERLTRAIEDDLAIPAARQSLTVRGGDDG